MTIIEYNDPLKMLPIEREYVESRTIDGKVYAVKIDLANFTLPTIETVDAVSWLDGAKYGTHDIINHVVDWDKVYAHIDRAFATDVRSEATPYEKRS